MNLHIYDYVLRMTCSLGNYNPESVKAVVAINKHPLKHLNGKK